MKLSLFRHLPVAMALTLVAPGLLAQGKSQEQLQQSYDEMQTHDWFTGGGWGTDLAAAKAEAEKTGKPILAYFTRTYAP